MAAKISGGYATRPLRLRPQPYAPCGRRIGPRKCLPYRQGIHTVCIPYGRMGIAAANRVIAKGGATCILDKRVDGTKVDGTSMGIPCSLCRKRVALLTSSGIAIRGTLERPSMQYYCTDRERFFWVQVEILCSTDSIGACKKIWCGCQGVGIWCGMRGRFALLYTCPST